MLGPFRIRNLRRPITQQNLTSPPPSSRRGSWDRVVRIAGWEYDRNVLSYPESKLTYLDDDDGEKVTVGTSMELSQRLADPFHEISGINSQHSKTGPSTDNSPSEVHSGSLSIHVFEIDHCGNSQKIWEEIERRTKDMQPLDPEPLSVNNTVAEPVTADNIAQNYRAREYTWEQQPEFKLSIPRHSPASMAARCEDEVVGASDNHLPPQTMHAERINVSQTPPTLKNMLVEDERTRYFKATNPPQIFRDQSSHDDEPARHTSMRLSDVLNDDFEPREVCEETPDLLNSFLEGLTAEGRRQAMEAGERLRLRSKPIPQENLYQNMPHESIGRNRWALYSADVPVTVLPVQPNIATEPISPLVHGPTRVVRDLYPPFQILPEGSLLEAFRKELAKISTPDDKFVNCEAINKDSQPQAEGDEPEVKAVPDTKKASLEETASKLVLQAIGSISSNIATLTSQLNDHVLSGIPKSDPTTTSTEESLSAMSVRCGLHKACSEFKSSVESSTQLLAAEDAVDQTNECSLKTAAKNLSLMARAVDLLSERLRSIEDMKSLLGQTNNLDQTQEVAIIIDPVPKWAAPSNVHELFDTIEADYYDGRFGVIGISVVQPANSKLPIAKCKMQGRTKASELCSVLSNRWWHGHRLNALLENANTSYYDKLGQLIVGLNRPRLSHHIPGQLKSDGIWCPFPSRAKVLQGVINGRNEGPTFQSESSQAAMHVNETEQSMEQDSKSAEPVISYRHVPSLLPVHSHSQRRGRQVMKMSSMPLAESQLYTTATPAAESTQRPVPIRDSSRETRSRSRSPDIANTRDADRDTPLHIRPRPHSVHYSSLPVRAQRHAEDRASVNSLRSGLRPFNSTNALNHEYKASGYHSIPQSRPSDALYGVRFGPEAIDVSGYAMKSNVVERGQNTSRSANGASLRYSKSLSAMRKAPPSLKTPTHRHPDEDNSVSSTLKEPFDGRLHRSTFTPAAIRPVSQPENTKLAEPSSPLVATRFPTLEQFEGRDQISATRFPPLPSMEPLVPLRPNAPKTNATVQENLEPSSEFAKANDPTSPKIYEETWPQRPVSLGATSESSGDFFRRMTGLGASPKLPESPVSPIRLGPAAPGARLAKPFDPLAETATIHRHQLIDGVRRSFTVSDSHDRYASTSTRRPYSTYFDGNGRVEWDSFVQGDRNQKLMVDDSVRTHNLSCDVVPTRRSNMPQRARTVNDGASTYRHAELPPYSLTRPIGQGSLPQRTRPVFDGTSTPVHHDPSTVSAVQSCVEQLKNLGFGTEKDGGVKRLVVYAQAANGNLEDAMDMIDEERKVYEERRG